MISTISNKAVNLCWVVVDFNSTKKVFKYQRKALADLGFTVTIGGSMFKRYENKEAVIADRESIREAYRMMKEAHGDAQGAVITDKQFGMVKDLKYIPVASVMQKAIFNNLAK